MVAHQAVQHVTLISGQGFPDGRPSRVPAQACPQLGDSSQATRLARSVIMLTQVRHGGGLVFFSSWPQRVWWCWWCRCGLASYRCPPPPPSCGDCHCCHHRHPPALPTHSIQPWPPPPHLFVILQNTSHCRLLEHVLRIVIVIVAFVVGARMHGGSSAAIYLGPAPSVPQ